MKVTAEPTENITTCNGAPCRAWIAHTETGVAFIMFVTMVAVEEGADQAAFERELLSVGPPREVEFTYSLRARSRN